jgi:hypothetical protein
MPPGQRPVYRHKMPVEKICERDYEPAPVLINAGF